MSKLTALLCASMAGLLAVVATLVARLVTWLVPAPLRISKDHLFPVVVVVVMLAFARDTV
jgi:hypothetical protein